MVNRIPSILTAHSFELLSANGVSKRHANLVQLHQTLVNSNYRGLRTASMPTLAFRLVAYQAGWLKTALRYAFIVSGQLRPHHTLSWRQATLCTAGIADKHRLCCGHAYQGTAANYRDSAVTRHQYRILDRCRVRQPAFVQSLPRWLHFDQFDRPLSAR